MIDEIERIGAVNRFISLDAGIKNDLDELVNLIAQICSVPVALISLIDEKMQWFKASVGTGGINCNERQLSFCQETIIQDDVLIVPDALLDERFAHLPIVTGPPHIRFYAGAPLVTYDGHAVGTLCVLDVKPAALNDLQVNSVRVLARQVLNLIELNWSMQSLVEQTANTQLQNKVIEDSEIKLKAVFDSSKDMHLLLGRKMEVLAFNKAVARYIKTHYNKDIAIGVHFLTIANHSLARLVADNVHMALAGEVINAELLLRPKEATSCWLSVTFEPVTNNQDVIIGVAINATDITLSKLNAEQIDQQNAALQRIATIQSHELRRPVASLMGLMEVLKLDDDYVYNSYHTMIEATINELDNKIKDIVHESETTIHNTMIQVPQTQGTCFK